MFEIRLALVILVGILAFFTFVTIAAINSNNTIKNTTNHNNKPFGNV